MAKLRSRHQTGPRVETLEPRILYSADPAPVAIVNEFAAALVQPPQAAAQAPVSTAQQSAAVTEWVVIDSRVPDADSLIADLQAQRDAGRQIGWLVIDANQDGVSAVSSLLAGQESIQALHFVTHGEEGSLQIGRDVIDLDTLRERAGEVAAWSSALTADADLLVYGCDVAAGEQGQAFVQALAALTSADVAASVDATGVLSQGGDWLLEAETGQIEATQAFGEQTRERWDHVLNVVPDGAETLVNNGTSSQQLLGSGRGSNQAVALPGGGAFVVWQNNNTSLIMGRLISPAGVPTGGDIQISSSGFSASEPAVAFDSANNRIVVAWTSAGEDTSGDGIFSRVLDVTGNPVSPVAQINQGTAGNQSQVAVAVNSAGLAVFTWTDDTFGSTVSIAARGVDYTNATAYAQLIVNDSTGAVGGWADPWVQKNSSVAFADNGEMLVVWESVGQDGAGKGVYGQWFDSSLVSRGLEFQISTATSGDQFDATVAGGAGGEFVVGWTDNRSADSVYARQYRADTTAKSAPFELQPLSLSAQGELSLGMTASGGFVAAYDWDNAPGDGDQNGILVAEYASDRSGKGFHVLLNSTTNGEQTTPTVVLSGTAGRVVWAGNGTGDSNGIFSRDFDLVDPAVVVTPTAGTTTTEAGGTAAFSVHLSTAPLANVVVNLSTSRPTEGVVSTSSMTFTTSNWNVAQTVTVTGVDDTYVDGAQSYALTANPSSLDPQYNALGSILTTLQNNDNDTQNIIVVTTLSDTGGGDVSSIAALYLDKGGDGKISLREAIDAANATANGSGGTDIIRFDPSLAGGVITVGSALSTISQPLWIDAITGLSFVDRPLITLDGNNGNYLGLEIGTSGGGSKISGLAIVDFSDDGILVRGNSNTIEHNFLGIRSDGVTDDGNTRGLHINGSSGNAIRNNLISGNSDDGILVNGGASNAIEDNRIGVDLNASSKVGNGEEGIHLLSTSNNLIRNNTIGGNTTAGIRLQGTATQSNVIAGNSIGTNSAGVLDLGNAQSGVVFQDGASANRVGGVNISDANLIAHNTKFGVQVYNGTGSTVGNQILTNRMYSNGGGIGLGVTGLETASNPPNDALDADTGGNNYQNTPVLFSAIPGSGVLQITGELNSVPVAGYRIQFFASPAPNASGYGEGATFLGHVDVTTDGTGLATFSVSPSFTGTEGTIISATATRYDNTALRWADTSPFSANVIASAAPVWATAPAASVAEGQTSVLSLSASDPNGPSASIVYSIVGGADAARFQVIGTALSFVTAPNFEVPASAASSNTYSVILRATDVASEQSDLSLSVNVTNVAEAPVWVTSGTQSINEGGTTVVSLVATDPDNNPAPITYSIVGGSDQGSFQMVGSQLRFVTAPDFEAPADSNGDNIYTVQVRAQDGGGDVSVRTFAVSVLDLNEAPAFINPGATLVMDENQTFVANLTATDPDGPTGPITYSIAGGADASRFQIVGNVLSFGFARDYELPSSAMGSNTYSVTLRATDGAGAFSDQALSVTINNVAEPPVWSTLTAYDVNEGNTPVVSLLASDPDNNPAPMDYAIVGGVDQALFTLLGTQLQFVAAPDFEAPGDANVDNIYHVRVRAVDGAGSFSDQDIDVSVRNVNEAPVFSGPAAALSVNENQTLVATLTATDQDGPSGAIVYSVAGGADAARFKIAGDVLSFVSARNFESPSSTLGTNTYTVTVRATDAAGASSTRALTVSINNVAEQPAWQTASSMSRPENTQLVTSLVATDPDLTPGPMTYSIQSGASAARFVLNGTNLMFVAAPDFEVPGDVDGDNIYSVKVRATDAGGDFRDRTFSITVTNVNEPPVIGGPTAVVTAEDQAIQFGSSSATTIQVRDPDQVKAPVVVAIRADIGVLSLGALQGLTFTAGDGSADPQMQFTGALDDVAAALAGLSYSSPAQYNGVARITITVTDPTLPSAPATLTVAVSVESVNDVPVLVQNVLLELPTGLQTAITSNYLDAIDVEDGPQQLTYRIQSLPPELRLMLDGNMLRAGDQFTQADLNSGRLSVVSNSTASVESTVHLKLEDTSGGSVDDVGLVIKSIAPLVGSPASSGSGSAAKLSGNGAGSTGAATSESAQVTTSSANTAPAAAGQVAISPSGITRSNGSTAGARGADSSGPVLSNENRQAIVIHQRDAQRGVDPALHDSVDRSKSQGAAAATRLAMLDDLRRDSGNNTIERSDNRSTGPSFQTVKAVLQQRELVRDLDRVREQVEERVNIERNFVASSAAISASVSIGYVIWLIRGGVLLSSLLASVPAWSSIDPLPILSSGGGKRPDADDDESLEELLSKARRVEEAQASTRAVDPGKLGAHAELAVAR